MKAMHIYLKIALLIMISIANSCTSKQSEYTVPDEILMEHLKFSPYTDPCEYGYLYDALPESFPEICNRIKKQLIHPFDTKKYSDKIPSERVYEDREIPTVKSMLEKLLERDEKGLTSSRLPENRLVVACVHHSLLLASILRSRGVPARIRAGYATYIGKDRNIKVSHVVCEVWDQIEKKWIFVDPDRNKVDFPRHQFELAADVWESLRKNTLNKSKYISRYETVEQATVHLLCHDLSYIIGDEVPYWLDPPIVKKSKAGISQLTENELLKLDELARFIKKPDVYRDMLAKMQRETALFQFDDDH